MEVSVSVQAELSPDRLGLCKQVMAMQKLIDSVLMDAQWAIAEVVEEPKAEYFEMLASGPDDGLRISLKLKMCGLTEAANEVLIEKWVGMGLRVFVHDGVGV